MDESLVALIHAAFPVGFPPDRPVTGHRCTECDEVDDLVGGRTWVDVAEDFPEYCHDSFPLLTRAAQIYYLPAYLCFEVESPGYMAGLSVASAMERGDLTPGPFSAGQRAVIWAWASAFYRTQAEQVPPEAVTASWAPAER